MNCVFCELIAKGDKTPNDWYEAGPGYRVFTPLSPVVKGHLLVVPTEHVTDALDDPRVTAFIMGAAASVANSHKIGPCNFITSVGREATQSVFHLHIHIVPRQENDGLQLPWSEKFCKTIPCIMPEGHRSRHTCRHGESWFGFQEAPTS